MSVSVCHANMCYPTEGDTTTCYLGNTWAHCYQCKGLFSHYHCSHVHTYTTITHCGVWLCFLLSAEKTAALSEGTCSTLCCQTEEVRMFIESFVQRGSWNGLWGRQYTYCILSSLVGAQTRVVFILHSIFYFWGIFIYLCTLNGSVNCESFTLHQHQLCKLQLATGKVTN